MANKVYPKGKAAFMRGEINLVTDTINVQLVSEAVDFDTAHEFFDDIATGATNRIGATTALASKTVTVSGEDSIFSATNPTIAGVPMGTDVDAYIIYKVGDSEGESPLLAFVDTDSTGDFTVTPNGSAILIDWAGSGEVFRF